MQTSPPQDSVADWLGTKGVSMKVPEYEQFPKEFYDAIGTAIYNAKIDNQNAGSTLPIKFYVDYPLTWTQVKDESKRLTFEHHNPVLVLPRTKPEKAYEKMKNKPYSGFYCGFEGQVTLARVDNDKNTLFEIARTVFKEKAKGKDMDAPDEPVYALKFPDDGVVRGTYQPDLSFKLAKHSYSVHTNDLNIVAYTDVPLELGTSYRLGGLMWSAADRKNTKAQPFHDVYMLVDWAIPLRNLLKIDDDYFARFKGLSHADFVNSCAFPFENSVSDYKELLFFSVFYIKSSTIPLNILLIGVPGCTKSAFLKRMASISGDKFMDSGSSTLKGFMPSFSPKAMSAGHLASAKNFVILNEFFEVVRQAGKSEAPYAILSTMKNILEGEKTTVTSGIGSMEIMMRGSIFMASNWPTLRGSGRISTVNELYQDMDPALLDRILVYPVPHMLQNELVKSHLGFVKERFKKFTSQSGIREEVRVLEHLPTPYPLSTFDLRTLLVFKEKLVTQMDDNAVHVLIQAGSDIQKMHGYDVYSRAQDFIANMASAYAFERMLSEGLVTKDTQIITITSQDIQRASSYYKLILQRHSGKTEGAQSSRQEFYRNSATGPQKYVIDELKKKWESGVDTDSRSVPFDMFVDEFMRRYPEVSWNVLIRSLIEQHIVCWDGERLMWLPDKLEDGPLTALLRGGSALAPYIDVLYNLSLIEGTSLGGEIVSPWVWSPPNQPSEGIQNLVRESLKGHAQPVTLEEIEKQNPTANADELKNAISYLHLSGEIWRIKDGFLLKAAARDQKR